MKKTFIVCMLIMIIVSLAGCAVSTNSIQGAVEDRDSDKLIELINKYNEDDKKVEELDECLKTALLKATKTTDYNDFVFVDDVLAGIDKEYGTYEVIKDVVSENAKFKVMSFIDGEWVRKDATYYDGMVIKVNTSSDEVIGTVTSVKNCLYNKGTFGIDDIKWDSIKVIDEKTFKFNDTSKGDYSDSENKSLAKIDYKNNRINITGTDSTEYYEQGKKQTWFKKDYVESFEKDGYLTESDRKMKESGKDKSEKVNKMFKQLNSGETWFWGYADADDPDSDSDIEGDFVTNREIELGSTYDEVIKAYGLGSTGKFNKKNDFVYNWYGGKDVYNKELKKSKYFMQYREKNKKGIYYRFYFDKNDKVVFIVYGKDYKNRVLKEDYMK